MNKFVIVALLMTVCGLCMRSQTVQTPGPCLALDSVCLDIGDIPLDSVGVGEMRFRNAGSETLQIIRIFSECGCTIPSYCSDPVEPGGEGWIRVRFNSKGRPCGAFRKSLRIRSNASNPRVTLTVKGRVVSSAEPGRQ